MEDINTTQVAHPEMKNTVSEMKSKLNGIKRGDTMQKQD